jgi:RNA polymerase sigma-B factor
MTMTAVGSAVDRPERSRRTRELLLAAHATDDPSRRAELLDEVVVLNRSVAEAVANRYRGRGVAVEDLHQAAYEGLIRAVQKFDPSVRPDLLTYAVPTIRGQVQRWFRDQSWMVRPPRRFQELQGQLNRSVERLSTSAGRPPTELELSQDLGCTVGELREAIAAFGCFRPSSLDRRVGDEASGATLGDLLIDGSDIEAASDARLDLAVVLALLPERDRTVLYLRFVEELSQKDIGTRLDVTQVQVSRLLERILRTLRAELS